MKTINNIGLTECILSLHPNADFSIQAGEILWRKNDIPCPTNEQLEAEQIKLLAEYDSKQYQRDRASQYPSITDVVVALAEKEEGDDTMWKEITAQRAKVKSDNPKPE